VHAELDSLERERLIAGLGTYDIEVLTSCDLISESLDVPSVVVVILLRPTKRWCCSYSRSAAVSAPHRAKPR
jgi:superfamily II DNA or RNA helicase